MFMREIFSENVWKKMFFVGVIHSFLVALLFSSILKKKHIVFYAFLVQNPFEIVF
ncbi:MAG: hypothetical protein G01um101418_370 [Parcubacteria group bacterium Gr01-1014_18]|nr:MAG: hypothetical protein Greene041636_384 [Parcubacteria group bacterium Greene0416_36]TSC81091.1 MAG: hypothetical protein G01um101418_370 [Parcubacteria group bacterium Gr01-1014_18]TSC98493.1 MAG: hypothetical protein Greene101420_730 [Parcubacteria group bacterium Greene1014_20]TSD07342.1 MAG: hypothetical protein Greene07142_197 [Parcubacteria group bacterium Greene0714_2]